MPLVIQKNPDHIACGQDHYNLIMNLFILAYDNLTARAVKVKSLIEEIHVHTIQLKFTTTNISD